MAAKKKVTRYADGSVNAGEFFEARLGLQTFGGLLNTLRECEEESLSVFGKRLGLSAAKLCDIEKGRRGVSPERAAEWARKLGYSEPQFVALALQQQLDAAGIKLIVRIESAAVAKDRRTLDQQALIDARTRTRAVAPKTRRAG